MEGTSKTERTTRDARGSACYRAPELLDETKAFCTNKADIWSMWCILYELAIGRKAFESDFATFFYKLSPRELDVPLDETFDEESKWQITNSITCSLWLEPSSRPSASVLLDRFNQNCQPVRVWPVKEPIEPEFDKMDTSEPRCSGSKPALAQRPANQVFNHEDRTGPKQLIDGLYTKQLIVALFEEIPAPQSDHIHGTYVRQNIPATYVPQIACTMPATRVPLAPGDINAIKALEKRIDSQKEKRESAYELNSL
jgi:serine/threonine protein kinase